MKKDSLKENIAKILGVSSLEKELAFEIFLEKVAEVLDYNQAIKIKNLGAFQLKKNVPSDDEKSLIGGSETKKDKIIYSAFDQKSSRESNSLFLSFDVKAKSKNDFEFDDEIFSPGVGKPIIPINPENEDTDSSIHMIKKSLEERVAELISESEKVDNFDIWDDFYKNVEKPDEEILDVSHENSFELNTEETNLSADEDQEDLNKEKDEPITDSAIEDNITSEHKFDDSPEDLKDDEFDDFPQDTDEKLSSTNESFSQEEIDVMLNNVGLDEGDDIVEDDKYSTEKDLDAFAELTSMLANNDDDDFDEDDPFAKLEKTFSGEIDEPDEDDEPDQDSEEIPEFDEEVKEERITLADVDDIEPKDDNIDEDLEDGLEDQDDSESEILEEKDPEDDFRSSKTVEYSPENDSDDSEENTGESVKRKFGMMFWGIAALFVVVTIVGSYFLFFSGSSDDETNIVEKTELTDSSKKESFVKPISEEKTKPAITADESAKIPEEVSDQKVEKSIETTSPKESIKPITSPENDVEVARFIFTNGKEYSVQVSSWKNRSVAENEAERFKRMGYSSAIVSANLKKLGTWYRVRVGYFNSIQKAKEFQNKQK